MFMCDLVRVPAPMCLRVRMHTRAVVPCAYVVCVLACVNVRPSVCACVCLQLRACICVHECMHLRVYTHLCMCMWLWICVHGNVFMCAI